MIPLRKLFLVLGAFQIASAFTNLSFRQLASSRELIIASSNDDENYYDDFGDMVIGGDGEKSFIDPSLQSRFNEVAAGEREIESRIQGNWRQGHWSVRGCSLDPGAGEVKTQVSCLLSIDDVEDVVLVGRNDGSVLFLQLGDEYLAKFVTSLVAKEGENDSIQIKEGLKREDSNQFGPESSQTPLQFQVLAQIQSDGGSIVEMAFSDPLLFSVNAVNQLEYWEISEAGPLSETSTLLATLPSPVVSLKVLEIQGRSFLMCVCRNGEALLWKTTGSNVSPFASHQLPISEDGSDALLSFDSDAKYVYLGTEQGNVFIYDVQDISSDGLEPTPIKCFSPFADGNAGISAISSAGRGSMSNDRQETVALIVGSTNGKIKQYELIPRGDNALEYWPRLESQTMPGKAHILTNNENDEAILALKVLPDVILAASSNHLTMWNPASGEAMFGMQGLDFSLMKPSLIVQDSNSLLITNGMEELVCLHDFSAEELDIDGMIEASDED